MSDLYIQYGCGWCAPAGWLNFDASPTLRFERLPVIGKLHTRNAARFPANVIYGDVVRGLPVAEASCTGIYCSHVLEHLALDDADTALANTWRYLKPGGTFRLVVPDLQQLARNYLANPSADAAHAFMDAAYLGERQRPRGLGGLLRSWLGNSRHQWMWDENAMTERLRQTGFTRIRRCTFGDAADRRFDAIEEVSRFEGCLAMECSK